MGVPSNLHKDHNNKSGNDPKSFEFESQLDDIFLDDPYVVPEYTMSSAKRSNEDQTSGELKEDESKAKKTTFKSIGGCKYLKTYMDQQSTEAERRGRRCMRRSYFQS